MDRIRREGGIGPGPDELRRLREPYCRSTWPIPVPGIGAGVAERWSALLDSDELGLSEPIALELLSSAPGRAAYRRLAGELAGVRMLHLTEEARARALRVQELLAERGQHRGPKPVDLLIAAVAELHSAVLLHYDRHFDAIARVTGQPAEWLARRGSLG